MKIVKPTISATSRWIFSFFELWTPCYWVQKSRFSWKSILTISVLKNRNQNYTVRPSKCRSLL